MNSLSAQIQRIARLPLAESTPQACIRGWLVWCGLSTVVLGGLCLVPALAQPATNEAAQQAMLEGVEAMTAGNFSAAITAYTTVTQKMPEFAEGYFNLGLADQQAGKLDAARADLDTALRLKPGLRGANLFLGIIAYRENRFKDAESRLLLETRLDPRSAKAFMWLGVCRLAEDDPQGAIAPLDKAHALDPSDVDTLYHRGRAYLLVANSSYADMYKLAPDSMRVHQVLAESYVKSYRAKEAIGEFEAAVKMGPRQPGVHEQLGDQYWVAGELDKVAEAYREELRIDPYDVAAMYKLGSFLVLHQQTAEGVKLLRETLRADPSLADAHYYLADGLANIDQNEEAAREFELTVAADPSNDRALSAYYKLAQLYRKLNQASASQTALNNFRRMKAESNVRMDRKSEQIVRSRTELPVDDAEKAAISAEP